MTRPTLTLAAIKSAARKAYDENRLQAQHVTSTPCYRNALGHVCAIGAALDEPTLEKYADNYQLTVTGLIKAQAIFAPRSDQHGAQAIQFAHDDWLRAARVNPPNSEPVTSQRAEFLELIQ